MNAATHPSRKLRYVLRLAVFKRMPRCACHYCGDVFDSREMTLDHVIPLCRGGKNVPDNLVPCCTGCNAAKGAMAYAEFIGSIAA
jgi:5-methylcytosine-specific restriction endonuclease McrA